MPAYQQPAQMVEAIGFRCKGLLVLRISSHIPPQPSGRSQGKLSGGFRHHLHVLVAIRYYYLVEAVGIDVSP
jgi:hypothetical protein